ncbi:MAG: hypothetical protein BWY74_02501 [Firmicutes bacterium ADurb.Bin419]|nr:MAG: hypothetical protein BWY74_02501 [Firmicutes bacterium ADurb.Bin419]
MIEINIDKLKAELEKTEEGFFFKEIKRITGMNGQTKDIMGKTQDKYKFSIITGNNGKFFLVGADDKIDLTVNSKIFMTENNSFVIKKENGMIFLNPK